jgi:TolB-like protein
MSNPDAVTHEQVRSALAGILSSEGFSASARNRKLLEYVVGETLAGRADRIKAYTLATVVFERGADFDPQLDPVVRLEASRLRKALEHYYLTAGKDDPVRIDIPKGSYIPTFESALADSPAAAVSEPDAPKPVAPRRWGWRRSAQGSAIAAAVFAAIVAAVVILRPDGVDWGSARNKDPAAAETRPAIIVLPFTGDAQPTGSTLAYGLTVGVISDLARFKNIRVYGTETSYDDRSHDPAALLKTLGIAYIVEGQVSVADERFRSIISLIEAKSGRYVWSVRSDGTLSASEIFLRQGEIASLVARSIAQPYGVLFNDQIKEIKAKPPEHLTSYECVMVTELYRREESIGDFPTAHACLARAMRDDPFYSHAYAALSLLYSDEYRIAFGRDRTRADNRLTALGLAQEAVKIDPNSSTAFLALHTAYWPLNKVTESFAAAEQGLALNPNNTQLRASYGARLCLRGEWQRGLTLLREAFAMNPSLSDAYRYILSLDRYRSGDYRDALLEVSQINLPNDVFTQVLLAMVNSALDDKTAAQQAVQRIRAMAPDFSDRAIEGFRANNFDEAIIDDIAQGLARAGLELKAPSVVTQ